MAYKLNPSSSIKSKRRLVKGVSTDAGEIDGGTVDSDEMLTKPSAKMRRHSVSGDIGTSSMGCSPHAVSMRLLTRSYNRNAKSLILEGEGSSSLPVTPLASPALQRGKTVNSSLNSLDSQDEEESEEAKLQLKRSLKIKLRGGSNVKGFLLRTKKSSAEFDEAAMMNRDDFDLDFAMFTGEIDKDGEFEVNVLFSLSFLYPLFS